MRSLRALLASIFFMACFGTASLFALTVLFRIQWGGAPPRTGPCLAIELANAVQAVLGGVLCARIARRQREVVVLAVIVVLNGGLAAALVEWADWALYPRWMLWSESFLDSFAVLLGGRLCAHRSDPGRAAEVAPGPLATP